MTCTPVALALLVLSVTTASAQSTPPRAKTGEKVDAVINVVKADKQAQFEDYLKKFDAAAVKAGATDPAIKRIVTQTRTLKPRKANEDGTFTYIFLMDPLVEGGEYDMVAIMKRVMPEAEANAVFQQFLDAIVQERHQFVELVQGEQ
jgi:hypothetical protein